jgi:hypothetical protein
MLFDVAWPKSPFLPMLTVVHSQQTLWVHLKT